MAKHKTADRSVAARIAKAKVVVGPKQAIVLHLIRIDPDAAHGLGILDAINRDSKPGEEMQQAQLYMTLKRLLERELIGENGTVKLVGAPPLKLYRITKLGRDAIAASVAEAEALIRAIRNETR